jgi:hypothetical protein
MCQWAGPGAGGISRIGSGGGERVIDRRIRLPAVGALVKEDEEPKVVGVLFNNIDILSFLIDRKNGAWVRLELEVSLKDLLQIANCRAFLGINNTREVNQVGATDSHRPANSDASIRSFRDDEFIFTRTGGRI